MKVTSAFFLLLILFCFIVFPFCAKEETVKLTGMRWQPLDSGSTAEFRGICAVSANIAWASGREGTYVRTIDGGKTWTKGAVPGAEALDFRDIHAVDKNTAYVVSAGAPAKIYKTTDGGGTWIEQYRNENPAVFFNSMDFWDADNGIAVSDPVNGKFFLIITSDGGKTWEEIQSKNLPPAKEGEAGFAASGTCLIVEGGNSVHFVTGGSAARVFSSNNRGKSWSVMETNMLSGISSTGIFSIYFDGPNNGIIVGGDYTKPAGREGNCAITHDGGIIWSLLDDNTRPSGFRSCVKNVPGTDGEVYLAVGTSGTDLSLDGGLTWAKVDTTGYHTMSFDKKSGIGWAAGAGGRIAGFVKVTE